MNIGFPEMLFILVLALLIFGPKKLPEVGRTIGKTLGEFRRASNDLKRTIERELEEEKAPRPVVAAAAAPRMDANVHGAASPAPAPPVVAATVEPHAAVPTEAAQTATVSGETVRPS